MTLPDTLWRGGQSRPLDASTPSPAGGGGLGWGRVPVAAINDATWEPAPIPSFPRRRGKAPAAGCFPAFARMRKPPLEASSRARAGRSGPGHPQQSGQAEPPA